MNRYLLKNIIILILLLVNGFLLGSLALRQNSATDARRQTEEHLIALFAADGMTLTEDAFSHKTPSAALSLTRSLQLERDVAVFFLGGNVLREDQGGGTYTYTGSSGVARFRSNGSFEVAGSLSTGDVEDFCRKFCQAFACESVELELNASGTGSGTAVCRYRDLPVFNASVTFTVDQGTLMSVTGTLLPQEGTSLSGEEPLSAAAALTAFQSARRESGAVVSAVTETALCYELQSTSALTLTPAWRVVTDTSDYYVNCATGAVTPK